MKRRSGLAMQAMGMIGVLFGGDAMAATAQRSGAGTLADGSAAEVIALSNGHGVTAHVLTYGATLQDFILPGRDGKAVDVVLGHDTAQEYEAKQNFFGVTVGRYANRIAGATFTLDGTAYVLPANNGPNSLHGGGNGWDRRNWAVKSVTSGKVASVVLTLHSPDGEAGFPGAVDVTVTYAMDDSGALTITFDAATTKPTVINMTNHAIFNLAGEGSHLGALGHRLIIPASRYTPVGDTLIPTGELKAVAGGVFDFTQGRTVADGVRDGTDAQIRIGRGYDHNFVIDGGLTSQPKLVARLEDPASGRVLDVLSTEPGVQLYTGNFLDGTVAGKRGHIYRMGDGIALEPQKFPDSPNQPAFPSARVDPGKPYRHVMIYRPSVSQ